MQQITRLLMTLCLLFAIQRVFACDCTSEGAFLTVAPKAKLVALVKVTQYVSFKGINDQQTPVSMEVEVVDVYKGAETRRKIIVWGDNGFLCRPYLVQFHPGSYYVIAFYQASDGSKGPVHEAERPFDYTISSCGDYWLRVDIRRQKAIGTVTQKQQQIKLAVLKAKLAAG